MCGARARDSRVRSFLPVLRGCSSSCSLAPSLRFFFFGFVSFFSVRLLSDGLEAASCLPACLPPHERARMRARGWADASPRRARAL